ncbi:hypothetical protein Baya_4410 [Bagarius yarrelli]|uniref:Uncharacterized protein n=1 Tax=Bagarius yarrelli TaxID=175774 RepID=A0A556TQ16_BAGYA|nr:hypothetical protein Baya_4410 [Bagarius yarrelli]
MAGQHVPGGGHNSDPPAGHCGQGTAAVKLCSIEFCRCLCPVLSRKLCRYRKWHFACGGNGNSGALLNEAERSERPPEPVEIKTCPAGQKSAFL